MVTEMFKKKEQVMISFLNKEECCGCRACAASCPCDAITMKSDNEGFLYPVVDETVCVGCNKCVQSCPVINSSEKNTEKPSAYWAMNSDEKMRSESSSGGIFTVLAEKTINDGGIVFGAAMSDDCRSVRHISVDSIGDLYRLRGSKYVQSDIGDSYNRAKDYLDSGKKVLFSGTPCQIEGLLDFLGKDYENLICIDLICHGVPSPKVWEKYVQCVENSAKAHTQSVSFRSKRYGWHKYSVLFAFENKAEHINTLNDDLFMKTFLRDICLRPSCYSCKFKKLNRRSDITLADFWGVERLLPEIDDDKGVSLVIVHSAKGESFFRPVEHGLKSGETDLDSALRYNASMLNSVKPHKNRKLFFEKLDNTEFPELVNKYASLSLYRRIRGKLGIIKRKILGK